MATEGTINYQPNLLPPEAIDSEDVIDEFGGIQGKLVIIQQKLGSGQWKEVVGNGFVYIPLGTDQQVFMGAFGSNVRAKPKSGSAFPEEAVFEQFDRETTRMIEFTNLLDPNLHASKHAFLHALHTNSSPSAREITMRGIPFPQALREIGYTLMMSQPNLIGNQQTHDLTLQFLAVLNWAKTLEALEDFHKEGLVHGDQGQWGDRGNILISARGGRAVVIDYARVKKANNIYEQIEEKALHIDNIYSSWELSQASTLLHPELIKILEHKDYQMLSSTTFFTYARALLGKIIEFTREDPQEALRRMQFEYFLAMLDEQYYRQTGKHPPKSEILAMSKTIDSMYMRNTQDSPTKILPALI